jgi:hypothetical protein
MTASEFKEEFNLRYNNALEGAPGLDTFEISSYLTIAQEQYVKLNYDATKDNTSSFELKEKSRRILNELVKDEKISSTISSQRGLVDESKFYELSNNAMYIVLETATLSSASSTVIDGKVVRVLPVTHDEFMISYRNPFRKPNENKAWRMDISRENSKTTVEIISSENISKYNVRYISYPKPIIVGNLTTSSDVAGLGLTINGNTSVATCVLADLTHRDIVNIAVENAVLDYRESSLKARIEVDSRI